MCQPQLPPTFGSWTSTQRLHTLFNVDSWEMLAMGRYLRNWNGHTKAATTFCVDQYLQCHTG